jgi:hypothetical protein
MISVYIYLTQLFKDRGQECKEEKKKNPIPKRHAPNRECKLKTFANYKSISSQTNYIILESTSFHLGLNYVETSNCLNSELNHICHLLTLLGAHPISHVSRIRVKVFKPTNRLIFKHNIFLNE